MGCEGVDGVGGVVDIEMCVMRDGDIDMCVLGGDESDVCTPLGCIDEGGEPSCCVPSAPPTLIPNPSPPESPFTFRSPPPELTVRRCSCSALLPLTDGAGDDAAEEPPLASPLPPTLSSPLNKLGRSSNPLYPSYPAPCP